LYGADEESQTQGLCEGRKLLALLTYDPSNAQLQAMAKVEWFRRATWTSQDEEEFQSRLNRSRRDGGKAQYLRIQSLHLAMAGNHKAALQLLEQLLREYPVRREMASTHLQRAESLYALGYDEEAIKSFRASLSAQTDHPNVRTGVALAFAWFIMIRRRNDLYAEVETLIQRYERECVLLFPLARFKCAAVRALVAAEQGNLDRARSLAAQASAAATEAHSGLRYHPKLGLVDGIPAEVARRLAVISGSA